MEEEEAQGKGLDNREEARFKRRKEEEEGKEEEVEEGKEEESVSFRRYKSEA